MIDLLRRHSGLDFFFLPLSPHSLFILFLPLLFLVCGHSRNSQELVLLSCGRLSPGDDGGVGFDVDAGTGMCAGDAGLA